jgi:hypothetical protein
MGNTKKYTPPLMGGDKGEGVVLCLLPVPCYLDGCREPDSNQTKNPSPFMGEGRGEGDFVL